MNRRRPPALFVGLLAAAAGAGGETRAAEQSASRASWAVVTVGEAATGDLACVAVERVRARRSGAFLVEVGLAPATGSAAGGSNLTLSVPNGADLVAGIGYRRGGQAPVRGEWQSCSAELCRAVVPLSASEMRALLGEREIVVAYRPLRSGPPLAVTVDLTGAKPAWEKTLQCRGAQ